MTVIEAVLIRERDRTMAKSITEKAETKGHDDIAIFVGQFHVAGIKKILETQGWDVETNRTWVHPMELKAKFGKLGG